MIRQLLLTVLVAVIVFLIYRLKNRRAASVGNPQESHSVPPGKLSVQMISYIIIGFIVLFSSVFFVLDWLDDKSLITVRVINGQNVVTEYQIRKDALKGRTFTTTDGRVVELGNSDRLEILPE